MNVLGISTSPRNGATRHAIDLSLAFLEEKFDATTKLVDIRGKNLHFCIHCDHCLKEKKGCVFHDVMDEVIEALCWADLVIIGTPVYNGSVSGQCKTMMDRTRALVARDRHALLGKVGVALVTGGDRNGGQEMACPVINDFFIINHVIPVAGGAFGGNFGITFWSKDQGASGVDSDQEGLHCMRAVLRRAGKMALLLAGARGHQAVVDGELVGGGGGGDDSR